MTTLTLRWHAESLAVGKGQDTVAERGPIYGSLNTRAGTTSIQPYADAVTGSAEGPFRALEVQGPLDFSLTGILASVLNPLAEAEISVFTLSTFDTDWILVPAGSVDAATSALRDAGHKIEERA